MSLAALSAGAVAVMAVPAGGETVKRDHRLGFVGLKFDDSSAGHYINAFPILEKYGIKGIFCVNAGRFAAEPGGGKITAAQCVEMYRAGHEIVDHTLRHESAIWGPAGNVGEWTKRTEESLRILRELGIRVRGWNLPGGTGSVYTKELHDLMPRYYEYARGGKCDFGYAPFELGWHFKGDPFGYTGVSGSWESYVNAYSGPVAREVAVEALARLKSSRADQIQRGVLTSFCFHQIVDQNQAKWALEEFCRWVAENQLPSATMATAFEAFRNPRKFYAEDIQQIPCADFQYDIDRNGRPDGWEKCGFAPEGVSSPGKGRVARFGNGTGSRLFGPEPGRTRVSFALRSADDRPVKGRYQIMGVEILDNYARGKPRKLAEVAFEAGKDWREFTATVDVSVQTEHCSINFAIEGDRPVYVASPSWRRVVAAAGGSR